jgi:STE24 endopeptidase
LSQTKLSQTPLSLVFLILSAVAAMAAQAPAAKQPAHAAPAAQTATQPPAPTAATPAAAKPVEGYTLSPEKYEKAVAYSRARYRLYFVDFVYGVVVLLLVLGWRLGPKYRDWAQRASARRFVQVIVYAPLLLLSLGVLGLPTDIWGHWLSRKYEISVQGWGSWAWDWTKGQLIGLLLGTLLVWILYGVIRRSPRRWWFYFWLAALPILLFVIFIGPYVIDPLFFKFEPLQARQPELTAAIERVVQRAGMYIPPERMYQMDASVKTKALNAYVTGFGASKRVVVLDTTIARMTTPQTLFVFGHEMGHYVLRHIPKLLGFFAAVLLVFLYFGYRGMHWAIGRWGPHWAIRGVDDWASLPVLLLFISLLSFLFSPVGNTFGRHVEHQADIYGLEVTHGLTLDSAQVAAQSFQILGEVNLSDPHPSAFIRFWLYDHPPIPERVKFALEYDPWGKGESPQFVK